MVANRVTHERLIGLHSTSRVDGIVHGNAGSILATELREASRPHALLLIARVPDAALVLELPKQDAVKQSHFRPKYTARSKLAML